MQEKIEDEIELVVGNSLKLKTARIGLSTVAFNTIIQGKQKTIQTQTIFFTQNESGKQTVITINPQDIVHFVPGMIIWVVKTSTECIPCKNK